MKRFSKAAAIWLTTFCLATIALLFIAPAANAHVSVTSTFPKYNSVITDLPNEVLITFDSPLITIGAENPNRIEVIDPKGKSISIGETFVSQTSLSIALNPKSLKSSELGKYTIRYRVVSADGHGVSGSYRFTVALSVGSPTEDPSVATVQEHGFWHLHLAHTLQVVAALLVIGGWALYRLRFAREK